MQEQTKTDSSHWWMSFICVSSERRFSFLEETTDVQPFFHPTDRFHAGNKKNRQIRKNPIKQRMRFRSIIPQ